MQIIYFVAKIQISENKSKKKGFFICLSSESIFDEVKVRINEHKSKKKGFSLILSNRWSSESHRACTNGRVTEENVVNESIFGDDA